MFNILNRYVGIEDVGKMQNGLLEFGLLYGLLVANFGYQSGGFVKFYDDRYCLWKLMKISPIVALALFTYFHGAGLNERARKIQTLGIVLGGVGDWLIGSTKEGIVTGAIAFGLGHLCYMALFVPGNVKVVPAFLAGTLAWGLVANQLCLVPMIKDHPYAVGIMMVYSLLLTACLVFSYSHYQLGTARHKAGSDALFYRLLGFALFYASDNMLIFDHCGYPIPYSEILILGTYYSSQYFILKGLVHCESGDYIDDAQNRGNAKKGVKSN
ncbi:unnamed protein product, partial [Mesorhabditis spiculigera]